MNVPEPLLEVKALVKHFDVVQRGVLRRKRTGVVHAVDGIDFYINQTYLKRWNTEDEIADAFLFLAKNDGITGQVIYFDGGFTLK